VPDDSLGVLPFEMLPLGDGGKIVTDKRKMIPCVTGAEFFGDRNPISYYQSVTALTLARTFGKAKAAGDKRLVMADPIFGPDDQRLTGIPEETKMKSMGPALDKLMSAKQELNITWPRLELTAELGEFIKKLAPQSTDLFLGKEAAKEKLFSSPLQDYQTVVFATHGYVGSDLPGIQEPVLILTLWDQAAGRDGFVRLTEVMGMKLNADLVALTACESGLGKRISGEGVMGMGRAFQYAGAKSVLMSLWSVEETASVKLVEEFFRHLKDGKTKLEAINLARNKIRGQGYDHPLFWAPFILVGEID
jgi:CHAT domain-containing protein